MYLHLGVQETKLHIYCVLAFVVVKLRSWVRTRMTNDYRYTRTDLNASRILGSVVLFLVLLYLYRYLSFCTGSVHVASSLRRSWKAILHFKVLKKALGIILTFRCYKDVVETSNPENKHNRCHSDWDITVFHSLRNISRERQNNSYKADSTLDI